MCGYAAGGGVRGRRRGRWIGPMFDVQDALHLLVAGAERIIESIDGGKAWKPITRLPQKFDVPKPGGWFTNVAWDPSHDVIYASRMGFPTHKLERKKPR